MGIILQFPVTSIEIPEDVKAVKVKQPILHAGFQIFVTASFI